MGFSIQCLWLVTVGVNQSATEFNISSKSGPVSPECFFFLLEWISVEGSYHHLELSYHFNTN